MALNMKKISEKAAAQYAVEFLTEYAGDEIFIGNDIENILADRAIVIYQAVDDPAYYGGIIRFMDKQCIAINTKQVLRVRYYSAAHELWHLQYSLGKIPLAEVPNFDHERAADHFAAAVMLPERLIRNFMNKFSGDTEKLVFKIADISSMPYIAVLRRLQELGKKFPKAYSDRSESDWAIRRRNSGLSPIFLDKTDVFVQFTALTNEVKKQVQERRMTLDVASDLLKHLNPEQAAIFRQQRKKEIDDTWDVDDD